MSNEAGIVSKVWSFASVLRDDGVGYGDYLEKPYRQKRRGIRNSLQ